MPLTDVAKIFSHLQKAPASKEQIKEEPSEASIDPLPSTVDNNKRDNAEELLRAKNKEFQARKIAREIDFGLVKRAFKNAAVKVETFIKKNLPKMVSDLLDSGKTQKKSLSEDRHICDVKVRFYRGEIQVLAKSWLGRGGFKTVEKVAHLAGPFLPNQPGPLYAYAKVEERKELRLKLKTIEEKIYNAASINAPFSQIAELRQRKTKLKAQIESIQNSLLEEAAISKEFPNSDIVKMWVVTNQKDPSSIKGVMMELCDKGDLWDFVTTLSFPLPPLKLKNNLQLASRIAQALADIHSKGRGRCHLDMKCGNILLASKNGEIIPKLTDFGLSKNIGSYLANPCGTPPYVAPEIYDSARYASPSLDAWSLGIVFTELFYGPSANLFLWDNEAKSAGNDFFNHARYPNYKMAWERIGTEIKQRLYQYPAVDNVICHLLDLNPVTRWTAKMAADAFKILLKVF